MEKGNLYHLKRKKNLDLILLKRLGGDRPICADPFAAILSQFLLGCLGQAVM
jgi:hypothetical protein